MSRKKKSSTIHYRSFKADNEIEELDAEGIPAIIMAMKARQPVLGTCCSREHEKQPAFWEILSIVVKILSNIASLLNIFGPPQDNYFLTGTIS